MRADRRPAPGEFIRQLRDGSRVNHVQERWVRRFTWAQQGDVASGRLWFDSGLWRGVVHWRAERRGGAWQVVELGLPGAGLRCRRGDGGWRVVDSRRK